MKVRGRVRVKVRGRVRVRATCRVACAREAWLTTRSVHTASEPSRPASMPMTSVPRKGRSHRATSAFLCCHMTANSAKSAILLT